jgi:quercetin dioxygenase-like cupin family protein
MALRSRAKAIPGRCEVRVVDFSPSTAREIVEFGAVGASAVRCGEGEGEAHVYCVRMEPGGSIGPHPAGYDQLFLVVAGSGWAAGEDGSRVELREGYGAYFARGEIHSKGSERGMTVIMVQVTDLRPKQEGDGR